MKPLFWILFKDKKHYFMEFKNKALSMDKREYIHYYEILSDAHIQRETDLTKACISRIMTSLVGKTVLDIGWPPHLALT